MSYKLLAPPTPIAQLGDLATSSVTTKAKFNAILTVPFLDMVKINDTQTLYPIINDAFLNFTQLQLRDTNLVRKILNYALTLIALLPTIPGRMTPTVFVNTFSQIVAKYVEEANASLEETQAFYTKFSTIIVSIKEAMVAINKTIQDLTDQIEKNVDQLKQENILNVLLKTFEKIFKLADGKNTVADLLNMSVNDLDKTFENASKPLIQQLVRNLKHLKDVNTDAYNKSQGLLTALKESFDLSLAMTGVWQLIQKDYDALKKDPTTFPTDYIPILVSQWSQTKADANSYLDSVNQITTASISGMAFFNNPLANKRIAPRTKAEKELEDLYRKFSAPHKPHERVLRTTGNIPSKDEGVKAFSPPSNMNELLDKMSKDSGRIARGFNTILQLPWLYSISVHDPDAPQDQQDKKVDLQTMITKMLKKYQALQLQTIPVARSLYTYSLNQLALIPNINKPGGLTLEKFLQLFGTVTQQYKKDADDIWQKTLKFSQEWQLSVNSIVQALNETKKNIEDWQKTVNELEEEKKKAILISVFAALGAIAFTVAAFLGGGVVAGAIGVGLLGLTIEEAIKAGKLNDAINGYKNSINTAQDTVNKLTELMPLLNDVSINLNTITQAWNQIATNLSTITAQMDMWNQFVDMPDLFGATVGIVIDAWTKVRDNVLIYIKVVSDANPQP